METVGEIIYTICVVFMCMSLVGLIYYFILVAIGLASNIINMLMFAGGIFVLHHIFISGGKEASEFSFLYWEAGVFIFAPVVATLTVLFVYIVGD